MFQMLWCTQNEVPMPDWQKGALFYVPTRCVDIILACIILNNMCIDEGDTENLPSPYDEGEEQEDESGFGEFGIVDQQVVFGDANLDNPITLMHKGRQNQKLLANRFRNE